MTGRALLRQRLLCTCLIAHYTADGARGYLWQARSWSEQAQPEQKDEFHTGNTLPDGIDGARRPRRASQNELDRWVLTLSGAVRRASECLARSRP
jgi:hypothetical protein